MRSSIGWTFVHENQPEKKYQATINKLVDLSLLIKERKPQIKLDLGIRKEKLVKHGRIKFIAGLNSKVASNPLTRSI